MPMRAKLYVTAVALTALAVAGMTLPETPWRQAAILPVVVLSLVQALVLATAQIPLLSESPTAPSAVAVLVAALVLLPPAVAGLVGMVGGLVLLARRIPPYRGAFVTAFCFLAPTVAGTVYGHFGGSRVLNASQFPAALVPIGAALLTLATVIAVCVRGLEVAGGRMRLRFAARDVLFKVIPRNLSYGFVGLLTAALGPNGYRAPALLVLLGALVITRWATVQAVEQRAAHDSTVRAFVHAVEIKDLYTRGHSERVAKISEMIARRLILSEQRIEILKYAAILHDVGKLGVPTRLLQKTGRLDDAELAAIRLHPVRGVDVVRDIAFLDEAYTAILHHHERIDGLGYPSGLAGERIPRFARIIAVADAFDSMTSTRSYRGARSIQDALAELHTCAGSQFDPAMVAAIEAAIEDARIAGRPWTGDGTVPAPGQALAMYTDGPHRPAADGAPAPGARPDEYDHDDPAFVVVPVGHPVAEQSGAEPNPSGEERR